MPYDIKPIRGSKMVKVVNKQSGRVAAKKTSRAKAIKQVRLLMGLEKK